MPDITNRIARQQLAQDALETEIADATTITELNRVERVLRQTEVGNYTIRGRLLGLLRLRRMELESNARGA